MHVAGFARHISLLAIRANDKNKKNTNIFHLPYHYDIYIHILLVLNRT